MKPTSFPESNQVLGAGGNPNTEDLVIAVCLNEELSGGQKIPFIVSRWKLSPEELQKVQETGEIWISIMGTSMPPILPMVNHPFKEDTFKPLEFNR